ncbi:hypothetical protein [Prevotella sp. OH937_COT-195]|uniref:hypothetical protein n=1 Tax=Prevotella sp. OH937_COT-195 TaxID=2491051 RepID=UPI000F64BF3A|nr:hypothetical protein [Prevotella sp. OH937_COT-195]RRC99045.1 hypothetical protein EII32_08410 [Prevotella sp. OH937_COT-195]
MYLHGSFVNQQGDTIAVHIVTNADRTNSIEVGTDAAGIFFTADPVEIKSEVNDTFDHLLRQSASIRLLSRDFIADFFCASCRDAVVNIYRDGVCLFAGFIEPQTYSQPYNDVYDEVELNCIDALSALQYSKYKNVGSAGVLYKLTKAEAGQRTFYDIVTEILNGITSSIDIVGGRSIRYLYDGSKAVDNKSGNRYTVFKHLAISELLFFGGEEDDVWQQDEVLEEILRYLNLHIVQDGLTFYIFSWESVKDNAAISWRNIVNGQIDITAFKAVAICNDNVADCDTTINVGEVYNQLLLTCKIESVERVIESPLDEDLLTSPFFYWQKYCTEFSADGEGKSAYNAFKAMCHDKPTDYGAGRITDWFIQVMANSAWIFPKNGNTAVDLATLYGTGKNQQTLPNWLGENLGAAILSIGNVEINTAKNDNSPVSKVNMTNYLVVSVNGNDSDKEGEYYPDANDIKPNIPYAVYTGNNAGGNFSPADDKVTNYIVLSGKIVLNPVMKMTDTYRALHTDTDWRIALMIPKWWHETVPSRDNGDGRYYTRKYWKAIEPKDEVTWDASTDYGLVPFTGKGPERYEFKYSAIGDSTDNISKISVLACMLIIGDKCVVESGTQGQTSDFEWKTYKTREQCRDDDEYYQQCFYIGFNPKIGDKLVGTEFDLQNNISYTMGVDTEGTAIPVRKSDKLSGQVKFMVLGPVNTIWGNITRRHPTFFRRTKWSTDSVPLLAHVSNIMVKQFEVKVYSDNGLTNNVKDNDIIYMSDTREEFTNKKDNLEFKINSALTVTECQELGVVSTINISTPINTETKDGVLTIYDYNKGKQAKPEQIYVDSYYTEYHLPRILMEQKLLDRGGIIGLFYHYTHPALNKAFFVQGISRNLIEGRADLKIKEIDE